MTREEWLNAVAKGLAPAFKRLGHPLPPFRVSIGFPSTGRRGKRIGECHAASLSKDAHHEIFIRPDQADPVEVAQVLAHELVHCAVGIGHGHRKAFKQLANAMGLEGRMRETVAGEKFRERIEPILEDVGAMPHAALSLRRGTGLTDAPKKQTTRILKAECASCGYTVRIAKSWAVLARPQCPLDNQALKIEGMADDE